MKIGRRLFLLGLLVFLISTAPCPAIGTLSLSFKLDNFGWRPGDRKQAICVQNPGATVEIRDSQSDALVTTVSKISNYGLDADSGDTVWILDFTPFQTPGKYYLYSTSLGIRSYEFEVDNAIYNRVGEAAMKAFYYQRCNHAKADPYAGDWKDGVCHTNDFHMSAWPGGNLAGHGAIGAQPNLGILDLHGGWHDAGDYQKTPHWDRGVDELLWAYEVNPKAWRDNQFNIPESGNGIPDILDEISWELDFYVRMQRPDGHFLSSASGVDSSSTMDSPPSACNQVRGYIDAYSDEATVWSVLKLAHAAIIYKKLGVSAKASVYGQAATNGWRWLTGRSLTGNVNNMKCAAASAVWRLEPAMTSARNFVETFTTWQTPPGSGGGMGPATYDYLPRAVYHYLANTNSAQSVRTNMKTGYANNVNNVIRAERDAYCGLRPQDYNWGSSAYQATYGFRLLMADYFGILGAYASFQDMRSHAQNYLHYLLGRNTMSMVYYTSMQNIGGEHSCFQTYHSWFSYRPYSTDGDNGNTNYNGKPTSVVEPFYPYYTGDNIANDNFTSRYGPAPGILVGGPNQNYSGDYVPPRSQVYLARFYRDFSKGCAWTGSKCAASSWEITECSLGYMGPGVLLIAFNMVDAKVTVTGFSPSSGCVGTTVTIRGDHFGQTRGTGFVRFGPVKATNYPFWSMTNVQVLVPGGASTGKISLTNQSSTGWISSNNYSIPAPGVTTYSPKTACPDDPIMVRGAGFGAVQGSGLATVAGVPAATYPYWSDTNIVFLCPDITNSGPLSVVNNCGGSGTAVTNLTLFCSHPLGFFRIVHDNEAVSGRWEFLSVKAMDIYTNVKNDYTGTVSLSVTGASGEIAWQVVGTNATFLDGGAGRNWAVCGFRPGDAGILQFRIMDPAVESLNIVSRDRASGALDADTEGFLHFRGLDHFKLSHDGTAFVGLPEPVILRAESTNGNSVPYAGLITIGFAAPPSGTVNFTLTGGSGILASVGGNLWTYAMTLSDAGVATLSIVSSTPDSIDINAWDGWVQDDDSEPRYLDIVVNNYRFVRKNNSVPVSPYVTPAAAATNILQAVQVSLAGDVILIIDNATYPALNLTGVNANNRTIAAAATNSPRIFSTGATPALNTDDTAANSRRLTFRNLAFINPSGPLRNLFASGGGGRNMTNAIFYNCKFSNATADGDNAAPDTAVDYYYSTFIGNGTYAVQFGGNDPVSKEFIGNDVRGFQTAVYNIDIGPFAGNFVRAMTGTGGGITLDAYDGSTALSCANNTLYRNNGGALDGYNLMSATNNIAVSNNLGLLAANYGVQVDTATAHDFNDSFGNGLGNNFSGAMNPGDRSVPPVFVNAAAGDFRLGFNSPLYNAGAPNPANGVRSCPGAHPWGVRVSDKNIGAVTAYTLTFVTFLPLPATGWIQLDFPSGTDLSGVWDITSTLNGGFTWSILGTRLLVKRNGTGTIPQVFKAHRLVVKGIRNPATGSQSYSVLAGTRQGNPGRLEGDWLDFPRLSNCYEIAQMPAVFSVSPPKFCPGTTVTVTGSNFGPTSGSVKFGGMNAVAYPAWTPTSISAIVPQGVPDGSVQVSNSAGYVSAAFGTYNFRPTITNTFPAVLCPGTTVTVKGSGFRDFQGGGFVRFNGVKAVTYLSWSDTNVTVIAPAGIAAGDISLTNDCGFGFDYARFRASYPSTNITLTAQNMDHSVRLAGTAADIESIAGNTMVGNMDKGAPNPRNADHRGYWTFSLAGIPSACPVTSATLFLKVQQFVGTPRYPFQIDHVKYSNQFGTAYQARYDCTNTPRKVLSAGFQTIATGTISSGVYRPIPCTSQVRYSSTNLLNWILAGSPRVFQVRMRDNDGAVQENCRIEFYEYGVFGNEPLLKVRYQVGTNVPAYTLPAISVSAMSPTNGPAGTAVTISGTGFCPAQGAGFVSFNGVHPVVYSSWNDTNIVVLVPAGSVSGPVRVTNSCGAGAGVLNFSIQTASLPATFLIFKTLTNLTRGGVPSKLVPGSTAEMVVFCSNWGTNAAVKAVVYEPLHFPYVTYASNSHQTPAGWSVEWSTNAFPDQSYLSGTYSAVCPAVKGIRWVRWKRPVVPAGTSAVFRYRFRIR